MTYRNFRNIFLLVFLLTLFALNPMHIFASGDHRDLTFSSNGKLATDFDNGIDEANDVAVQANGKIVVVGRSNGLAAVARYNPNGTPDFTFNGSGKVTTSLTGSAVLKSVIIQPDGKIVAAGYEVFPAPFMLVVRYNSNGSLDTTFGNNGIVNTFFIEHSNTTCSLNDIAIQNDGKLIAVGRSDDSTVSNITDWAIVRYNTNGSLDTTFGSGGRVAVDLGGNSSESAEAVAILSTGKILVGGYGNPGGEEFALVQLTTNGTLDTNFDGDGKVTTDFNNLNDRLYDVKVQTDGKIVAAGRAGASGSFNFALARYNANGSLDTTFDTDGKVETNVNPSGSDSVNAIALQADGRIVAVGDNGNLDFTLARYNRNGSLDLSFGRAGKLFTDIFSSSPDTANSVAVQTDGRILVVGTATNTTGSDSDFAVARYLPNPGNNFDFDGDNKTDISIFRPSNGQWWYYRSSDGGNYAATFGTSTDKLVPGDFTGDGKTDIALFRPSTGEWFILRSEDGSYYSFPFGTNGDIPAPADYDADGKADAAVFRPSTVTWYIRRSSDSGTTIQQFGASDDVPAVADYDGDGKSDIAIWRASAGQWWINRSTAGIIAFTFGNSADKPVQGDYTGDGKADMAIWRPATGEWFILRSEDFSYYSFPFGTSGDIPAPGDFDGDGRFDATVFRPSQSTWYAQRSTAGTLIQGFGIAGDTPVPSAFIP